MGVDMAELKFGGKAYSIAEDELAASFTDDRGGQLINSLWEDYQKDGCPKNVKAWLRPRLEDLFACVDERPKWIERRTVPTWPFHDGYPMVFIRQFEVPSTPISEARMDPSTVLYVFGSRIKTEGGWKMHYRVMAQHRDL